MDDCFGDKIRKLRWENNLTLKQVTDRLGITPIYLSDVERSKRPPFGEDRIIELASILGCDAWDLLELAAMDKGIVVIKLNRLTKTDLANLMGIYRSIFDYKKVQSGSTDALDEASELAQVEDASK